MDINETSNYLSNSVHIFPAAIEVIRARSLFYYCGLDNVLLRSLVRISFEFHSFMSSKYSTVLQCGFPSSEIKTLQLSFVKS